MLLRIWKFHLRGQQGLLHQGLDVWKMLGDLQWWHLVGECFCLSPLGLLFLSLSFLMVAPNWVLHSVSKIYIFKYIFSITYKHCKVYKSVISILVMCVFLTRTVDPLAARATMSAHETVWGHACSNLDLILSITSKPRTEFLFGPPFFSLAIAALSSNKIDASQPFH